ncbi:unnamed protein product [Peniophora sp. CBMAI 1063]|nr:unnamed protein product [Peniophora sp. CBMAI 1063]
MKRTAVQPQSPRKVRVLEHLEAAHDHSTSFVSLQEGLEIESDSIGKPAALGMSLYIIPRHLSFTPGAASSSWSRLYFATYEDFFLYARQREHPAVRALRMRRADNPSPMAVDAPLPVVMPVPVTLPPVPIAGGLFSRVGVSSYESMCTPVSLQAHPTPLSVGYNGLFHRGDLPNNDAMRVAGLVSERCISPMAMPLDLTPIEELPLLDNRDKVHDVVEDWSRAIEDGRQHVVSIGMLNRWFKYVSTVRDLCEVDHIVEQLPHPANAPMLLVSGSSLRLLCAEFVMFQKQHISLLFERHCLRRGQSSNAVALVQLREHLQSCRCPGEYYVFAELGSQRRLQKRTRYASGHALDPQTEKIRRRRPKTVPVVVPAPELPIPLLRDPDVPADLFPEQYSNELRDTIIFEWQAMMEPIEWTRKTCAVCGQMHFRDRVLVRDVPDEQLELLQDHSVPANLMPVAYDLNIYRFALLHPDGVILPRARGSLQLCTSCSSSLKRRKMPKDAIANKLYYAHDRLPPVVKSAFAKATLADKMFMAGCRMTKITFLIENPEDSGRQLPRQGANRGHCAFIPQDSGALTRVLPPAPDDPSLGICVLFVGRGVAPTKENLATVLHPLLCQLQVLSVVCPFLAQSNRAFRDRNIMYSEANLRAIGSAFPDSETGLASNVQLTVLDSGSAVGVHHAMQSGYSNADRADLVVPAGQSFIQNVGYANETQSSKAATAAKAQALDWILNKKPFVQVTDGSQLFSDRDRDALTLTHPHLDPYALGPFFHEDRIGPRHLSMQRQLKNMLLMKDAPFAADPNFAYVFFNAIQRMQTSTAATFRVAENQYASFTDTLMENRGMLEALEGKYRANPDAQPTTSGERKLVNAMNQLRVMCKDVMGSNASRTRMRSKLRALLKSFGCPTLFVTLNPTDVLSLQLHILCGGNADDFSQMNDYERTKQVVEHPAETAIWFDRIMKLFINIVLRHNSEGPGLFGTSEAYFGTVEAQGRGSLHCHMLLWCKGSLSPQDIRNKMQSDEAFRDRMFGWLECIVKCELPGMQEVLRQRPGEELENPLDKTQGKPGLRIPPLIPNPETMSSEERALFEERFQDFVHDLACAFNWHKHRATCWKKLKPGQEKTDANCRMRIDGHTTPFTELDEETGAILLRRLHPWINNFNDVVLFLLRSNMDVKYIGSGQVAKALVYYITDYISKGTLPMHVGLAAVIAAIKKMELSAPADSDEVTANVQRRRFLIKCVNAMMGRVELSHQQVMSYLVGGGDFYSSHQFASLYWGDMSKFHLPPVLSSGEDDDVEEYAGGVDVTVNLRDNDIVPSSQLLDYRFRPSGHGFDEISVWEFAGLVEKSKIKRKTDEAVDPPASAMYEVDDGHEGELSGMASRAKLSFMEPHPQADTHVIHLRGNVHVPILSGPVIPRYSSEDGDACERFCRAMLILFKPWRERGDLLGGYGTWKAAYDAHRFPDHLSRTIRNIHVEHECKEARDDHSRAWREGLQEDLLSGATNGRLYGLSSVDPDLFEFAMMCETADSSGLVFPDRDEAGEDPDVDNRPKVPYLGHIPPSAAQSAKILERSDILAPDAAIQEHLASQRGTPAMSLQASFRVPDLVKMRKFMEKLRKLRRPIAKASNRQREATGASSRARSSRVTVERLKKPVEKIVERPLVLESADGMVNSLDDDSDQTVLAQIIKDFEMKDNAEQRLVMQIFDDHHERGMCRKEQLLMYVAGVGGTGKSHVIRAVTSYLGKQGHADWILIAAPTGIAAVLVDGYTIHALTYLNVGGNGRDDNYCELNAEKKKAIEAIWRRVRYLIIDEVSMISATQLTYISKRLKEARSTLPGGDLPFGGVNIVATGDFGQLEPVGGRALFHTSLVNRLDESAGSTDSKQFALHGAYLWRLFDKVVELKKVVRQQDDPEYGDMLSRIRVGSATTCGPGGVMEGSDYHTVSQRTLDSIRVGGAESLTKFQDAPIIVGDRVSRDALNLRLVHTKAMRSGVQPVFLCAKDRQTGTKTPLSGPLAKAAILLPPGRADTLGCMPYFPGMRVMITENLAMCHKAVNGQEGVLQKVVTEEGADGMLHATCAFVKVEGIGQVYPELPEDIVPVFPSRTTHKFWSVYADTWVSFVREQLPLMPAYVYTDYKAQGRSLDEVIVDLASTTKPQGRYVMLSRVRSLAGLAVLRPFSSECFSRPLQKYIKDELRRVSELASQTKWEFRENPHKDDEEYEDDLGMTVDATSEDGEPMDVEASSSSQDGTDSESSAIEDDEDCDTNSEVYSDYEEEYMVTDGEEYEIEMEVEGEF